MRRKFRTDGFTYLKLNCHQGEMYDERTGRTTNVDKDRKEGVIDITINDGEGVMKMGINTFYLRVDPYPSINLDADRYLIYINPSKFFQHINLMVFDNGIKIRQQAVNYRFDGNCTVL